MPVEMVCPQELHKHQWQYTGGRSQRRCPLTTISANVSLYESLPKPNEKNESSDARHSGSQEARLLKKNRHRRSSGRGREDLDLPGAIGRWACSRR